ncbi:PAS domain S-box protein [Nodosilinea sp. LEGE 07088]|uniref:PAS domain S-box protein n=1 Tax=Nodosilinea sp. LEGE 07088 TaxID=2777968 RepID=UPI0028BD6D11|nr:PAS domain S-box protein [Nodosilinea sp. LEGE 07088]
MPLDSQGSSLFNLALDAMVIADDRGQYVEANPAACRLLNLTRDQILGRTITDFCVRPPDLDVGLAQHQLQGEMTLRGGHGEARVVEYVTTPDFCPHFHLSIWRDVTQFRQAHDQLQENHTRLQPLAQPQLDPTPSMLDSMLDNIDGVVWSVELPTMAIQYVNAAVEGLSGYRAEAFLDSPELWRSLIYPADRPKIEQGWRQVGSHAQFAIEYRIIRLDGELRWVCDRSRVIYNSEGAPVRLYTVTIDITEQKQTEEALRLSESRLRAIFHQAALGINQAALDGRFLQANQAYCAMLGYSEAELLQLRYQDVAHPDECQATEAAIAKLYAQEATSVSLEKRYIHKDGRVIWTNIVLSILWDADGQAVSDIAIVQDISDRKRTEQALAEERSLFINGPTIVVRWGASAGWPIEYISPNVQTELGYVPKTLIEEQVAFADLMHPDDVERVQAEIAAATAAQAPCFARQYRLRHANGEYGWIDSFTRVIYGPDGAVSQFLGYIQDVTERKRTELALQESEATKQAMLEAIPDLLIRINRQGLYCDFISGGEITLYPHNTDAEIHFPRSIYDMLPQDLADQRVHVTHRALDTGERQIYENQLVINGEIHYEEARIVPINPHEALIMVRDITDRVAAQLALQESQRRFEAIFNQMYQFMGLLTPDGILLEANQTALNFAGLERSDVVGRPFWETSWWQISEAIQVQLKQAIAAAAQGEFIRYEVMWQGANRQVITIDFSLRPIFDEHGQVVLLIPEGRDITTRKQTEEELRRTKSILEQTNSVARVGGWELDLQQSNLHWTPVTRAIHEVEADFEPTLATALDFYPEGANRDRIIAAVTQARQTGQPWDEKLKIITAKGNFRWVRVLGQAEFRQGNCVRLFGAFQDIDAQMQTELQLQALTQQLQQANGELNRIATTDALTQLANRRHFDQLLAQEWARAARNKTPLALIMCDVDHFKLYNDHYGHPAGDRCLQQVALLLQDHIQRPGDVLARYGGEEFVVLLPKTALTGAIAVAARIKASFAKAQLPHGFSPVANHITVSCGVASCIPPGQNLASELLAAADAALYQAKLAGRNRYNIGTMNPADNLD